MKLCYIIKTGEKYVGREEKFAKCDLEHATVFEGFDDLRGKIKFGKTNEFLSEKDNPVGAILAGFYPFGLKTPPSFWEDVEVIPVTKKKEVTVTKQMMSPWRKKEETNNSAEKMIEQIILQLQHARRLFQWIPYSKSTYNAENS